MFSPLFCVSEWREKEKQRERQLLNKSHGIRPTTPTGAKESEKALDFFILFC